MSKPLNPHAEEWWPSIPTTHPPPAPPIFYTYNQHQPYFSSFLHKRDSHFRLKGKGRDVPPWFTKPPSPPARKKKMWVKKEVNSAPTNSDHRRAATTSESLVSQPPENSSLTTVMIKNIPNKFRRGFMLDFVDGYCRTYALEYDFLYMPSDFKLKNNLGYAFVNFTTVKAANEFKRVLQNFKWEAVDGASKKICDIQWAKFQGKAAMVRRFQNCSFEYDSVDFLPVVLDPPRNGWDQSPPPPVVVGRLASS